MCLSTLFRHHAKGQPSSPNTHFRSPRGRVCVSVTVVQNKFYLSLLYPELDLASYDPLPPASDQAQTDLSGAVVKTKEPVHTPIPPQPLPPASPTQSELLGL